MKGEDLSYRQIRKVLRLMELQRKTLEQAGADRALLDTYSRVLRHVSRLTRTQLDAPAPARPPGRRNSPPVAELPAVQSLTLEQIEALLRDESTTRKLLEKVAIDRFHVPRGSMRSFSNMDILREKIATAVRNERAHSSITSVAQHPRR